MSHQSQAAPSDLSDTLSPARAGTLALEHIGMRYPGAAVESLSDMCLEIEAGEFVTLLGPSGCGKTTTLRIIAGFENPTAGRVLLDGTDITEQSPNKRPMSMVFQNYALFPHMNVYDNVAFGLTMQKWKPAAITDAVTIALASMNLTGMEERYPHQLSGGQQQRVALARAMVLRPSVMLFDEPLSNLDAKLRDQMRTEIRQLQERLGITSVYVTHDQDEAMSMSDRVIVMNHGKIEQSGSPSTIYRYPATRFVADFIGRASFIPVDVRGRGSSGEVTVTAFGTTSQVAAHPDVDLRGLLLVRPENVSVAPVDHDATGSVVSAMYYGSSVEYEIETADGKVLVSVPVPDQLLDQGTPVALTLDAGRAYVLPDDEAVAV